MVYLDLFWVICFGLLYDCRKKTFERQGTAERGDHFRDIFLRHKIERHRSSALVMLIAQNTDQAPSSCLKSSPRTGGDGGHVELDKFDVFLAGFYGGFCKSVRFE